MSLPNRAFCPRSVSVSDSCRWNLEAAVFEDVSQISHDGRRNLVSSIATALAGLSSSLPPLRVVAVASPDSVPCLALNNGGSAADRFGDVAEDKSGRISWAPNVMSYTRVAVRLCLIALFRINILSFCTRQRNEQQAENRPWCVGDGTRDSRPGSATFYSCGQLSGFPSRDIVMNRLRNNYAGGSALEAEEKPW